MNNLHHISTLVASHDPWARNSVTTMLSDSGFRVQAASNGMSALRLAAASLPHIVLIGSGLPEVSVIDVVRTLRADARTRHTAVVHLQDRDGADAHAPDVDGVVVLPCSSIELLATVIAALEARHSAEILARRLSPVGGAASERRNVGASVRPARTLETPRVADAGCRD